jgi:glutamine synthetase
VPGFEAPVNLAYSARNRSAAIRIPMFSTNPKLKRLEFRPPDPSSNAYLAFSAMLLAGLDGVQNRIDPGEPLEKDIYDLSPEELKDVPTLPGSLDDSLKALEADHDFLLKGDVFSPQLIERWITYTRDREITPLRMRPHPLEFSLYYDMSARRNLIGPISPISSARIEPVRIEQVRKRGLPPPLLGLDERGQAPLPDLFYF